MFRLGLIDMFNRAENELDMPRKSGVFKVDAKFFLYHLKIKKSDCHGVKSQKIKSQKLHVPILETNRKKFAPAEKTSYTVIM